MIEKIKSYLKNKYDNIFIIISVISVVVFALIFRGFIYENELENSKERLKQVVGQQATLVSEIFDDIESYLIMISQVIESSEYDDISDELSKYVDIQGFDEIIIANPDGSGVSSLGSVVDVSNKNYFVKAMEGDMCIDNETTSSGYCDIKTIVSIPIKDNNGVVKSAIIGYFYINDISFFNEVSGMNNDINTTIVSDYIDIIYDSDLNYMTKGNYSSDNVHSNISLVYPETPQDIIDDIKNYKSSSMQYNLGNEDRYCYYMPLEINNWYIFISVPAEYILSQLSVINSATLKLLITVSIFVISSSMILMYFIKKNKESIMDINNELKISEKTFRIASEQSNKTIFDYSINDNKITIIEHNCFNDLPKVIEHIPNSLFESGIIAPEFEEEVYEAFKKIRNGEESVSFTVRGNTKSARGCWYEFDIVNFFDDNGNISNSLGVIQDITYKKYTEKIYNKKKSFEDAMTGENMIIVEVDENTGTYKHTVNMERVTFDFDKCKSFSQFKQVVLDNYVFEDDLEKANYIFDSDTEVVDMELRIIIGDVENKNYEWVSIVKNIIKDPVYNINKSIYYMKNIDEAKKESIMLKQSAEIDGLTGILNRATLENQIHMYLLKSNRSAVFMIIDVDKFKEVNDTYGHSVGDEVLKITANRLKEAFRNDDIVGRMGGDEFIVLVEYIDDIEVVKNKAKILSSPHKYVVGDIEMELTLSIGISRFPYDGETYDELYSSADEALYHSKDRGRGCYTVYDEY